MRILLSTIGSRGDVQPLVALASELEALGEDVHLCVPPDFRAWIEGLGMAVTPIGPEVRSTGKVESNGAANHTRAASPDDRRDGRRAVRDDRRGRSGVRRHRRSDGDPDRRAVGRGADGHSICLRRVLPDRPAVASPRSARSRLAGGHASAAGRGLQRAVGPGHAALERRVAAATQHAARAPRSRADRRRARATSSPLGPGWPPTRRSARGPSPPTTASFRPAPGSSPTSVRSLRRSRRFSTRASLPSISASAASGPRRM